VQPCAAAGGHSKCTGNRSSDDVQQGAGAPASSGSGGGGDVRSSFLPVAGPLASSSSGDGGYGTSSGTGTLNVKGSGMAAQVRGKMHVVSGQLLLLLRLLHCK
jgi:hypothetical protein